MASCDFSDIVKRRCCAGRCNLLEDVVGYAQFDGMISTPPPPPPWTDTPSFDRTSDLDALREQVQTLDNLLRGFQATYNLYAARHQAGSLPPGSGAYVAEFPTVIERFRRLEELRRQQFMAAATYSRTKLRKVYRDVYQDRRHLRTPSLPEPWIVKADSDTFTRAIIAQLITEELEVSGDELMDLLAAES